jgi:hypothetical protein
MRFATVYLADGTSYGTSINGTDEEIRAYFVGQTLNMGEGGDDKMILCTGVEIQ